MTIDWSRDNPQIQFRLEFSDRFMQPRKLVANSIARVGSAHAKTDSIREHR